MTSRIHRFRELTVTHTAYEAWFGRQGSRVAFSKIQTAPGAYDMMRCFRRAVFCILRATRLLRRAATFFFQRAASRRVTTTGDTGDRSPVTFWLLRTIQVVSGDRTPCGPQ